jgi:hypothetical protein
MSLPTSTANFNALAPRTSGELITSADWNALVAACKNVQDTVNGLSQAVDTRLTAAESALQAAVARVAALEAVVHEFRRVTLKPTRAIYALGETAVISASVADSAGQPMTFTAVNRPWVTFICTWGRLRAVPGFESSPGFGDRSVTVRTNAQGLAQVRLQPDHTGGFDLDLEDEVSTTMTGRVAAQDRSAADIIRSAETPGTARDAGAFKFLSVEYDRADSKHMRNYVDTYYRRYPALVAGKRVVNVRQTWQDYRSTVISFVQNSNDVSAPDFGRASASTLVVFRDWISPWYHLEYAFDTTALVKDYRERLTPKFTLDLVESINNVKQEVKVLIADQGALRKQRDYRVIRDALDQITLPQPPVFLNAVRQSVQHAIAIQQTIQGVQDWTAELPAEDVAFEVFTHAATRSDVSVASANAAVAAAQQKLAALQAATAEAQAKLQVLQNNLTLVGGRLDAALADSGAVGSLRLQLNTVKNQVAALSALNPAEISANIGTVGDLKQRVFMLESRR